MRTICIKTPHGIDLPLNTKITIDGRELEVCGLAKQEYIDGLLWQRWIVMPSGHERKEATHD